MSIIVVFLCLVASNAYSGELRELYRGARATAMGNASVAIADDEQAIFLNPAGLASSQKYRINYVTIDLEGSTDVVSTLQESTKAFKNLSGDSLNVLMGKNVYGRGQLTPSIMMPNFGVSVLMDGQIALRIENKALPQIQIGYQTTNGVQAAYGYSFAPKKIRKTSEFRVGIGGKLLWRRGGYRLYTGAKLFNIGRDTISEIAGGYQRGIGIDLGAQYIHRFRKRPFILSAGVAYTDVGDTTFGNGPDPQKGNLSCGVAIQYTQKLIKATLAYDYRHVLEDTDWRKKNHLGIEVALPMLSLYGGLNQVALSYGVGFDFWLFRIYALSYAEDQGSFMNQDSERRYLLRINMKLGL